MQTFTPLRSFHCFLPVYNTQYRKRPQQSKKVAVSPLFFRWGKIDPARIFSDRWFGVLSKLGDLFCLAKGEFLEIVSSTAISVVFLMGSGKIRVRCSSDASASARLRLRFL